MPPRAVGHFQAQLHSRVERVLKPVLVDVRVRRAQHGERFHRPRSPIGRRRIAKQRFIKLERPMRAEMRPCLPFDEEISQLDLEQPF